MCYVISCINNISLATGVCELAACERLYDSPSRPEATSETEMTNCHLVSLIIRVSDDSLILLSMLPCLKDAAFML